MQYLSKLVARMYYTSKNVGRMQYRGKQAERMQYKSREQECTIQASKLKNAGYKQGSNNSQANKRKNAMYKKVGSKNSKYNQAIRRMQCRVQAGNQAEECNIQASKQEE
jgi:hypothetical protein